MKRKQILPILTIFILVSISFQSAKTNVQADFQKGTVDNIEDWFTSTSLVNFTQDYKMNIYFNIANETLGYALAPRLSLNTRMNVPLNFTSYLHKDVKDGTSEYGLQIGSTTGNFTLGVNGTVIIVTPNTGPIYINVTEGEIESVANFDTLLGEHLTIQINFSPMVCTLNDISIPEHPEIQSIGVSLTPKAWLEGTIKLNATVLGEELSWMDQNDIYFSEVPVEDKSTIFSTSISNITLDFSNIRLSLTGLDVSFIYGTTIGTITQYFEFDFSSIEWIEGEQALGDVFIFLIDTLFVIEDMEVYVSIEKTSFSLLSILAAVALLSGLIYLRKRRS